MTDFDHAVAKFANENNLKQKRQLFVDIMTTYMVPAVSEYVRLASDE